MMGCVLTWLRYRCFYCYTSICYVLFFVSFATANSSKSECHLFPEGLDGFYSNSTVYIKYLKEITMEKLFTLNTNGWIPFPKASVTTYKQPWGIIFLVLSSRFDILFCLMRLVNLKHHHSSVNVSNIDPGKVVTNKIFTSKQKVTPCPEMGLCFVCHWYKHFVGLRRKQAVLFPHD